MELPQRFNHGKLLSIAWTTWNGPLKLKTQRKDTDNKTDRKQRKDNKVQEYTVIYKGSVKTQNNASETGH